MTPGPAKNNVWLASYPKSGNTWMRIALLTLQEGGETAQLSRMANNVGVFLAMRHRLDMALDVDSSDLSPDETLLLRPKIYGLMDRPPAKATIWKVHDCWERTAQGEAMFPAEATAAAIYLVRDPRDVAASFAHHFDVGLDKAIAIMADPSYRVAAKTDSSFFHLPQVYSSWSENVSSWIDRSGLDPLVVRYEEMVADLGEVLGKVSATIGWSCGQAQIEGAVRATRFDRLREQEKRGEFPETLRGERLFFRRGVVGGWRDTLSPAQVARIERDHGAVMERLGYL